MGVALREIFASFGVSFDTKELDKGNASVKGASVRINELRKAIDEMDRAGDITPIQKMRRELGDLEAAEKKLLDAEKKIVETRKKEIESFKKFAGVVAGVVVGVGAFVRNMYQGALASGDMSRQLGISTRSLREWQFVAEASGLPVEDMNSALTTLSGNMRAATTGNYDMAYQFRRLGVDIRDPSGRLRDVGDVALEVGVRMTQIERPVLRAQYVMRMFGESGRLLVPIFEQGAASINAMREEVRAVTGGDLDAMTTQTRLMRAEMARTNLVVEGLTSSIFVEMLPTVRWLVVEVGSALRTFKKFREETSVLKLVYEVFAVTAAARTLQFGAALLKTFGVAGFKRLPVFVGIALMVLMLDDLRGLMEGEKSLIGEWLDAWGGAGTAANFVESIKIGVEGIRDALFDAINGYRRLRGLPPLETSAEAKAATDRMTAAQNEASRATDRFNQVRSHANITYSGDAPRYVPTQYEAGQTYGVNPRFANGGIQSTSRAIGPPVESRPRYVQAVEYNAGDITIMAAPGMTPSQVADEVVRRQAAARTAELAEMRRTLVPVGGQQQE